MDACCCPPPSQAAPAPCPECGRRGERVRLRTVQSLLTVDAMPRIGRGPYQYCPNSSCDVVYFDAAGSMFARREVHVAIGDKDGAATATVCYCFGETLERMREEFRATGRVEAVSRVRAHIASRRCACDLRNPRGTCCLGDLIAAAAAVVALP